MKYLICSDIHGSSDSADFLINEFKAGCYDYIICLGDVLYHGPRNDLPNNYNPKEVIKLLNPLKDKIICVKGNCDAEVDQMVLDFEINNHLDITINGLNTHLEHGHHLQEYNGDASIVLYGHTHVSVIENIDNKIYINPGSITLPKNGQSRNFAIWEENVIRIYSINKELIAEYKY